MKNKIEEMIRVDHAGERGAIKIYDGQLLALQLLKADPDFEQQMADRKIRPTLFLPLWDFLGTALGFGTAVLGKKAAMLCTASVEEVIDKHYLDQIDYLSKNEKKEKNLLKKVKKFRQDELDHRDIAYKEGASKEGAYGLLDAFIKIGSKAAIEISKKI
jgi:ubiquinone biosynthesis monooxygenase Coq7